MTAGGGEVTPNDPRIEAMCRVQLGNPEGVYFEDATTEALSLAPDAAESLLAAADAVDPVRARLAAVEAARDEIQRLVNSNDIELGNRVPGDPDYGYWLGRFAGGADVLDVLTAALGADMKEEDQ